MHDPKKMVSVTCTRINEAFCSVQVCFVPHMPSHTDVNNASEISVNRYLAKQKSCDWCRLCFVSVGDDWLACRIYHQDQLPFEEVSLSVKQLFPITHICMHKWCTLWQIFLLGVSLSVTHMFLSIPSTTKECLLHFIRSTIADLADEKKD